MSDDLDRRREQSVYGREGEIPERLLYDLANTPVVPESKIDGLVRIGKVNRARLLAILLRRG